jgi:hypothetical protein
MEGKKEDRRMALIELKIGTCVGCLTILRFISKGQIRLIASVISNGGEA